MNCIQFRISLWVILPFFLSLVRAETGKIVDPRPGFDTTENNVLVPQTRIIGGSNAREDRYPYFVSLVDNSGKHTCGGSLVAPDVVVTAAHCQGATRRAEVGRWNRGSSNDDFDDIAIDFPEFPHPEYSDEGFPNDCMLVKLERQSSKQYVKLNDNPDLPRGSVENEVTVMGFGNTVAGVMSQADILQEVQLGYIPNPICELSRDSRLDLSYQNQIIDSMLCAGDYGEDSCQGDSGGPLVVGAGSAEQDVLVGIISWGFGCALPEFPGVYSRVSAQFEWLRTKICEISGAPPSYLNCENVTVLPSASVPVTVGIQFDDFPGETSWSITSKTGGTAFAEVPAGTYNEARSRVQETVFLPAGGTVVFEIDDTFGDGLCCNTPGNYIVSLGTRPNGEILVSGGGRFDGAQLHEFVVPDDYSEEDINDVPSIGQGQIPLTFVLQLDSSPQEIGWKVERLGIEVETVIEIPAGIYKIPGATIVRTIILEKNELYHFRVYDVTSDGIDGGYVQLFLGTADVEDESKKVFEADGDFKGGVDFSFLATTDPQPTEAPLNEGDAYLTLQLYFDLYPGEVGVQLRASNTETAIERQSSRDNTVIFFRPPRYYTDFVNERVTERIPIPPPSVGARREFILIVTDSFSDGLCCNWNRTWQTGYTLYNGDPAFGEVLVDSRFIGTEREVTSFVVESSPEEGRDDGSGVVPQVEPDELVEIKVTITLDIFPDETGFYIEDSSGFRIADFPPGTFKDPDQVVEQLFIVPTGVYTFTVTDTFGDGINRDGAYYRIEIVGDGNRPAVLAGNGLFVTQKSHIFVLEGKSADYPMTIKFTNDNKPEELSFFVKRLDILEADAMVASVPPGTYKQEGENVAETIMVQKGALYRIIFEDVGKDGIGGDIIIIMGSDNANDFNAKSYLVDARKLSAKQIKLYAGQPPVPSTDGVSLDLRVTFDKFPQEMEWILVGSVDRFNLGLPSVRKQKVIAYGPLEPYSESLAAKEYVETIYLPDYAGMKTLSIIVTDAAGDGVCCTFGSGGPVELFQGSTEDGELLFSEPFQGVDRLVRSFVIVGSENSASFGRSLVSAIVVPLFVAWFSFF